MALIYYKPSFSFDRFDDIIDIGRKIDNFSKLLGILHNPYRNIVQFFDENCSF